MKRILFVFLLLAPLFTDAQIITTFAGGGTGGLGDGGPATAAKLNNPASVYSDKMGNVYIADFGNNIVRKVNSSGIISTIAGNNTQGYSGDGGPATAAQLSHPTYVAIDGVGNLYIADAFNNVIRKVNTHGIITTVAGRYTTGYTGDGGPATAAQLYDPNGVWADSAGNFYIADAHNNVIRKVNTSGTISTIIGNGYNAGTTHGGYAGDGGPATAAELFYPESVMIDKAGNFFVAELYNSTIRKVNTSGIIYTIAGTNVAGYSGDGGTATAAELGHPYDVAINSAGIIFIADNSNNVVRSIDSSGIIHTYAGNHIPGYSGDGGPATAAELHIPTSVSVDQYDNLYIVDDLNNVIRMVSARSTSVNQPVASVSPQLTVFPNPAISELTVASTDRIAMVAITNLVGQTVYTHKYESDKVQVDVADFPPGIYFVRINGTEVRKFVKQ
jgi:hypothetical protein